MEGKEQKEYDRILKLASETRYSLDDITNLRAVSGFSVDKIEEIKVVILHKTEFKSLDPLIHLVRCGMNNI